MIRVETPEPAAPSERPIVRLVLDRPDKRNALTPAMVARLADAARAIPDETAAVIIEGDGPVFCAGFDLRLCAADTTGATMRSLLRGLSEAVVVLRALVCPVVMAIHGAAVAGGCALLGGADIVVADRTTKLGYPVARIGVSPAVSAPFMLAGLHPGVCRTRLLDPELIDAHRARTLGLVHEMADGRDAACSRAESIARTIAAKPPGGLVATKRLVNELTEGMSAHADSALGVSLARVGTDEERSMLGSLWGDANKQETQE